MTILIQHDGRTWRMHTEVGDGPAKVEFDEVSKPQPAPTQLDNSSEWEDQ